MTAKAPPKRRSARGRVETLFEVLREGVALCEMIRDETGKVVDYRIREANPAYLKSLGGQVALGKTMRELRPDASQRWYDAWHRIMAAGAPTRFEYQDVKNGRWYDVHMTSPSASGPRPTWRICSTS
jgi:PAS domain-containing protein